VETLRLHAQAGHDGVLRIDIPVGIADVDCEIVVTIPSSVAQPMTTEELNRFVDETAGSLAANPIERLPQGDYEERDALQWDLSAAVRVAQR